MSKEILELCEKFVKKEKVEFIYTNVYSNNARIEGNDITKTNNYEGSGLMVRVLVNGNFGVTTITEINERNIIEAIDKAKKIAKIKKGTKISDFGNENSKVKTKQDTEILDFEISKHFKEIKQNLVKEKHIKSYEGRVSSSKGYSFYLNPYTFKENTTGNVSFSLAINTFDKKPSNAYASQVFTKKKDIDFISVIKDAKKEAKFLLNPKQGEKGEYDLIFSFDASASILSSFVIAPSIGELMFKKQSYLSSSLGKEIFSKNLTITEEPHLDYYLGSEGIDDEGIKTSKKDIIKSGVFNTAIYDQEYAVLSKTKPTGNGFRSGIYSPISCGFTNLLVSSGKKTEKEMIEKTKKGIFVTEVMGLHTSNVTNGDFSLTISSGKEIVDGKFKDTITNLNFTGNCKDTFRTIEMTKERKFFGNSLVPEMKIAKVRLI